MTLRNRPSRRRLDVIAPTEIDNLVAAPEPKLLGSGLLRTFGRATLWLWFDRGALRLGTAVAGLLLIRYLGPVNYGTYATALSYGALLGAFLDLGLTLHAARVVGVEKDAGKPIVATYLAVSLGALLLQLALIIAALEAGRWDLACIAAGLLLINGESTVAFCGYVLTAELQAKKTLPGSLLSAAGLIIIIVLVIQLHASVLFLLIGLCLKSLTVASLRIWQIRGHWPSREDCRWLRMRSTIVRSWPYFSYFLTQIGYERVSIVCLGLAAARSDVGLFGAAVTIASVYPQWSYAASDAVLPLLTRLFEYRQWDDLVVFRQRLLDLLLFVSVPVAVTLSIFAPQICTLLGARFAGSATVLRIVAYRSVVSVLDGFLGQAFLTAIGRVRARRNAQARALVVLAILTLSLGLYWGPVGAAIALLIADVVLFLQYLPICRSAGLGLHWPALWPSLVAGLCMALMASYLPHLNWVVKIAPSLLVYACVLVLLARDRVLHAGNTVWQCLGGSQP